MLLRSILRGSRIVPLQRSLALSALGRYRWAMIQSCRFLSSSCKLLHDGKLKTTGVQKASLETDKPKLMIAFTCKKCNTRSSHTMSKQAYTGGTVLITCPSCKTRHLIADHLKIFSDDHVTVEDILKAKGESVSSTTDDLAFEDIPKNLQSIIGHHAKNAPEELRGRIDTEKVDALPGKSEKTDT